MGELVGLALKNSGSEEYLGIDLAPHDILAVDLIRRSQSFHCRSAMDFDDRFCVLNTQITQKMQTQTK